VKGHKVASHYNSKTFYTKVNPFELTLGVEKKEPIDSTIPRTRECCEGDKNVKEMVRKCEELNDLFF
jgi:hypothetical protein